MARSDADRRRLPSVDEVLRVQSALLAVERFGRPAVVAAVRKVLADARSNGVEPAGPEQSAAAALIRLEADALPHLKPVYNLTGTVLHTNLGRALLAEQAIEAAICRHALAVALEFDLGSGRRGERDDLCAACCAN